MKYEKAKVEVISFNEYQIFAWTSTQEQAISDAVGCGGGFSMVGDTPQFNCSVFDKNSCGAYDKQRSKPGQHYWITTY